MAFLAWAQVGRTALAYAADLRPEVVGGVLNKLRCVCARLVALDHGVNPPHKHRRADEADRTCAMGRRREGRCEIGCYDTTTIKFMGQLTVGLGSQQKSMPTLNNDHHNKHKHVGRGHIPQRIASPRQNMAM
jgi:hypothetical protein